MTDRKAQKERQKDIARKRERKNRTDRVKTKGRARQ